jgi:alpha-N-arabinofuranosidase
MLKKFPILIAASICSNFLFSQNKPEYANPILAGFYPDPSICKAGNAYYLINSTFAYFPGLPVFKSYDLVHWKQIGNVINNASQIDFDGMGVSRGLFAPAIRFHDGIFYVTCTLVDGKGNFVTTATDPSGSWSNPVWLPEINGIDPSLFFDEDKAYIVYNSIPPDNQSLYDGHRTIRINEFDTKQLKVIGDNTILVNGGTDIAEKPSWIEGPHIVKKDGKYILYAAQGGTGLGHSEVAFKSNHIFGPYISYKNNPILTQKNSGNNRKSPITSTGHADLVETENGKWQAVFLGCRPYETDYYNTGRETFLAPVEWKDGWPIINPNFETIQYHYPLPFPSNKIKGAENYAGNFIFEDNFDTAKLQNGWLFLRAPKTSWYYITNKKLTLQLQPQTCAEKTNPSFIGRRQQHLNCTAITQLGFNTEKENEKAGLLIFQNESHYYFLAKTIQHNKPCIQLLKPAKNGEEIIASSTINPNQKSIQLKIEAKENTYSFYYSINNKNWVLLAENVDAKFLSTKVAGGFVGSMFALYGTSNGLQSSTKASFSWFQYSGNDKIYQ